jgi:hypothetical protein
LSGVSAKLNGFDVSVYKKNINYQKNINWQHDKATEQALLTSRQLKELAIRTHYLRRSTSVDTVLESVVVHIIFHTQTHSLVPNRQVTSSPTVGLICCGKTVPRALDIEYNPDGPTCFGHSHGTG